MPSETNTYAVEQQAGILDQAIGPYLQHGFVLRERTATSALLVRPKRYNRLAGLAFGLIFYYIYFTLFATDVTVTLELDPLGAVIRRQGKTRTRRASRKKGGVVLAVVAILAFVGIVAFGLKGLASGKGIHVCTDTNYDSSISQCLRDDGSFSVASLSTARITFATKDGSPLGGWRIGVRLQKLLVSGTYGAPNRARYIAPATATHTQTLLMNVFQDASVTPAIGTYQVHVTSSGTAGSQDLGSATFTLTP